MPRVVLAATRHPGRGQALGVRPSVPDDQLGIRAEAAHPDHRIVRFAGHIEDRGQIEIDAGLAEQPAEQLGGAAGQIGVVEGAERGCPG